MEHHVPLKRGRRIINMDHGPVNPPERLKGTLHQMLPALGQHLNRHVIRNQLPLHKLPQKIKLNLRRRRKSDFNFLKAHFHKKVKHFHLLFHHHGLHKSLVAVTQIHAAPNGRLFNFLIRPFSLRIVNHRHSLISLIIHHDFSSAFFYLPLMQPSVPAEPPLVFEEMQIRSSFWSFGVLPASSLITVHIFSDRSAFLRHPSYSCINSQNFSDFSKLHSRRPRSRSITVYRSTRNNVTLLGLTPYPSVLYKNDEFNYNILHLESQGKKP